MEWDEMRTALVFHGRVRAGLALVTRVGVSKPGGERVSILNCEF